jgi:hypothetical protein
MTDKALETLLMAAVFVPTITFAMIALHFSEKRKRKRDAADAADKEKYLRARAAAFFRDTKDGRMLPPLETHISLKRGERALLQEQCSFYETRTVRYHVGGGAGTRIGKVYVGGGGGRSTSQQELALIDSGTLVLTNQRLVFDGATQNRVADLRKLLSVQALLDAIEVSVESRQKSMLFGVGNPFVWSRVVTLAQSGEVTAGPPQGEPAEIRESDDQHDEQVAEATVACPLCSGAVPESAIREESNLCPHCKRSFNVKYEEPKRVAGSD